MPGRLKYILIDDDSINNTICRLSIKKYLGDVDIAIFNNATDGLNFIKGEYNSANLSWKGILFLDINMPELNGWDFLDIFETYDETIRKNISIYLLSSSINQQDIDKAGENANVISFISKPLTKSVLQQISGTA